jgi:hypothetical protein
LGAEQPQSATLQPFRRYTGDLPRVRDFGALVPEFALRSPAYDRASLDATIPFFWQELFDRVSRVNVKVLSQIFA